MPRSQETDYRRSGFGSTDNPHRFGTLDGMRGIAAIAVMIHHLTQHTTTPVFANAGIAVDLFFCLSGFVIAFSYLHRLQSGMSFASFLGKRFIRLYPMFLIGLTLGIAALTGKVASGQTTLGPIAAIEAAVLNAFYLPYFSDFKITLGKDAVSAPVFPANDPAWSLFFEIAVNLVFGVWALTTRNRNPFWLVAGGGIALAIYVRYTWNVAPGWGMENFVGGIPRTVFGFFAGVLLFSLLPRYERRLPSVAPAILLTALIALFLLPSAGSWASYVWLTNALFAVPALIALGSVSRTQNAAFAKHLDYLGWISYPLYCLHFPIYSLFTLATGNTAPAWSALLFCTPVTLVAAHWATKKIDEPFRRTLSKRFTTPSATV